MRGNTSQSEIKQGRWIHKHHWTGAGCLSDTRCMTDTTHLDLVRIVPSENMARLYEVALQPTLFGEVAVVRCWGRIGTRGRTIAVTYPDAEKAADAFARLEGKKRRRGYATTIGKLVWGGARIEATIAPTGLPIVVTTAGNAEHLQGL